MSTTTIIILSWLGIDLIIYIGMWLETIYYKHDLPKVYQKIIESFTEED